MDCDDCKYGRIVTGECRRNAPQASMTVGATARWPRVTPGERGCGQWVAQPGGREPARSLGLVGRLRATADGVDQAAAELPDKPKWSLPDVYVESVPICEVCGKVRGGQLALPEELCGCDSNAGK